MSRSVVRCVCVSLGLFLAVLMSPNRASAAESPHYYYCEPSNTFFPYAQTCSAPWKEIEAKPTVAAPTPQPAVVVSATPAPAPADTDAPRHGVIAYPKGMPAPIQAAVTSTPSPAPAVAAPVEQTSKGPIMFVFGAETPTIVCAVSQLCDVTLQMGEKVNQIVLGDPEHWKVDQANEGSGIGETAHLIVRPLTPDSDTSIIVFTKTRTYHLQLRSHRKEYMLQVAFSYPGMETPVAAKAEKEDAEDGLVKVGPTTYVKGREPKGWVGHATITPAEPGPAVPRPEVTKVKPQTP